MIGYTLAEFTMMRLGSFSFGINTAAYNDLRRTTEYKWAAQERFGQRDAMQFTGPGTDSISLSGIILTAYRGGTGQLDILRELADSGEPQTLISGLGSVMGRWIIEGVEEGQDVFAAAGMPRRQSFNVRLKKFDDGEEASVLERFSDAIEDITEATGLDGVLDTVNKFADDVIEVAGGAIKQVSDVLDKVNVIATQFGVPVGPVFTAATRTLSSASDMLAAGDTLKQSIAGLSNAKDVPAILEGVLTSSTALANASAVTVGVIKGTEPTIAGKPAAKTIEQAKVQVGKVAVAASETYSSGLAIIRKYTA